MWRGRRDRGWVVRASTRIVRKRLVVDLSVYNATLNMISHGRFETQQWQMKPAVHT